jgi:hypothetical protein
MRTRQGITVKTNIKFLNHSSCESITENCLIFDLTALDHNMLHSNHDEKYLLIYT